MRSPFEFGDYRFPSDMPWEEKKKIKAVCHYKVSQALKKGTIKKPDPPCPVCSSKIAPLVSHHFDYRKPLDVFWCCKSCQYKHHHLPNFFRLPMAGEIEELAKAAEWGNEAWKKLFIYPWPVLSVEDQAKRADEREAARAEFAEDEKLYREMEKAEGAWMEACYKLPRDEAAIKKAKDNMDRVFCHGEGRGNEIS